MISGSEPPVSESLTGIRRRLCHDSDIALG